MRAPALHALLLFVVGILLAAAVEIPSLAYLGVALLSTGAALVYTLVERLILGRITLAVALVACGGFLTRQQLSDFPSNHISHFTELGGKARIIGVVADEPDIRPTRTYLVVAAESLSYRDRTIPVSGRLRVRINEPTTAFNYKDRVAFGGFIGTPSAARNPGAFDYRHYLGSRGIHAVCYLAADDRVELLASGAGEPFIRSIVVPVRDYIIRTYERYLSVEHAALLRGFLIGDVRFIPESVHNRFQDTGTLHVLAASGSNVGYVLAAIFLILRPLCLRRPYRYLPALVGVVIFSFLAFNQPSVVRASVMAIVALVGMMAHRDNNWLNSVSVAGLIILAFRPLYLFDLGTQLSFAAAIALILFMPASEPWLPQGKSWPVKLARYLLILLLGSIIAQLGVVPILLHNFHTVPLVSFLANLVIVPLVGIITMLGIILIFLSPIAFVATVVGAALNHAMDFLGSALTVFDSLPIPPLRLGTPPLSMIFAYYLALLLLLALLKKSKSAVAFVWLLLIALNLGLWSAAIGGEAAQSRVTFLDAAKLPTVVVETPGHAPTLINAGTLERGFDAGEAIVLPFLRYRGITQLQHAYVTSTESQARDALASVLGGLYRHSPFPTIEPRDPIIRLEFDSLRFLLITANVPVQQLHKFVERVDVLGLDWRLLNNPATGDFVRRLQPSIVVILNYFSRYGGEAALTSFRLAHPNCRVWSILESGALQLIVARGTVRVLPMANT